MELRGEVWARPVDFSGPEFEAKENEEVIVLDTNIISAIMPEPPDSSVIPIPRWPNSRFYLGRPAITIF